MSRQNIARFAFITGAVAGAVLGGALLTSPVAHAEPTVPSSNDIFFPPGGPGTPTDVDEITGGLYTSIKENIPYSIYQPGGVNVIGNYEVARDYEALGGVGPIFENNLQQAFNSSGAAPADGTVWEQTAAGLQFGISRVNFFENFYTSGPTGSTQDLFQIDFLTNPVFANYYSSGPDGTLDEWLFPGGVHIPIIDIPGADSMTANFDPGDGSELWPDLAGLF